jgi:hypothetical protein
MSDSCCEGGGRSNSDDDDDDDDDDDESMLPVMSMGWYNMPDLVRLIGEAAVSSSG